MIDFSGRHFGKHIILMAVNKRGSNIAALELINEKLEPEKKIRVRQIKYLNNIVEQDHRFIKKITKPIEPDSRFCDVTFD